MHVKSSANMKGAELEDGEARFFLCMCRGWPGSGRSWGPGRCLEMGETPKLILNQLIVIGAVDAGGLRREHREKMKRERNLEIRIFCLHLS